MRILFLTASLPLSPLTGSELMSRTLLELLANIGARIDAAGYVHESSPVDTTLDGVFWHPVMTRRSNRCSVCIVRNVVSRKPYRMEANRSRQYIRMVNHLLEHHSYDLVIVDHWRMSWVRKLLPDELPVVNLVHNLPYVEYERLSVVHGSAFRRRIYRREARIARAEMMKKTFDAFWVFADNGIDVSERHNARLMSQLSPGLRPSESLNTLRVSGNHIALFGNLTQEAAALGLDWFLQEVLPMLPETSFVYVAGRGASPLGRWREERVNWVDDVKDINLFLRGASVIALPSMGGGGDVQVEMMAAAASARPVVCTSTSLLGFDSIPPNVLVADDPQQFASQITSSFQNNEEYDAEVQSWNALRYRRFHVSVENAVNEVLLLAEQRQTL